MLRRLRHLVVYQLERLLLGGSIYRLLVIAGAILLISFVAGLVVYEWELVLSGEADLFDAVWWAFLRMTDPGYLGDDEEPLRMVVSTIVTIAGYVLFMGALIAIMTQWLHATIDRLEQGLTPIVRRNHVVVLGWTDRTAEIVVELVSSGGRLRRFLHRVGARRLVIAVLAEDVSHELMVSLRERLGRRLRGSEVILRSGDPLRIEHLRRVDYARAGVIIIPGEEHSPVGEAEVDARNVKTLLTIDRFHTEDGARTPPSVVVALRDPRKVAAARSAYRGEVAILAVDAVMGRIMAQSLRHPGLSYILEEILTQTYGNEVYLREDPSLEGRTVRDLAKRFEDAVVLGLLRGHGPAATPLLNPGPEVRIETGDRLVLLADDYEVHQRRSPPPAAPAAASPARVVEVDRRVLILGWSHLVPDLLAELDQQGREAAVTVCSTVPPEDRERQLRRAEVRLDHLRLSHFEGDATVPRDLAEVDPLAYEDVLVMGSERLSSAEDSDARTLLVHHLVREAIEGAEVRPRVLVELHDPANADLFDHEDTEVVASGEVVSHLLAQMALRYDLGCVFDRLFGPGGPEIAFLPVETYGLVGERVDFDRLIDLAAARGETALGLRHPAAHVAGGVRLNPPRDLAVTLAAGDSVVVMRTMAEAGGLGTASANE